MVDVAEERRRSLERQGVHLEEPVEPDDTTDAIADRRAAAAEPSIRELRKQTFGSPDPPPEDVAREWRQERGDPENAAIHAAIATIARGTGFAEVDVEEWFLTGQRPRLARSFLAVEGRKERLPDGTVLVRRWATLMLHAPVDENAMRRIWRRLRAAWSDPAAGPDFRVMGNEPPPRRRTPRVGQLDRHAIGLVEAMPDATWEERLGQWKRTPPEGWAEQKWKEDQGAVSVDALRKRYVRAVKKLDSIEPREEHDA